MPDNNHTHIGWSKYQPYSKFDSNSKLKTVAAELWGRIVKFGFSLLYNQFAWTYDAVSWIVSLGAWRDWQRTALPFIRGPRILEIAHGPGHMLIALNEEGFQVTGIDISPQMVKIAQKRLRRVSNPVTIIQSSVQNLPFAPELFDSVLSTFPTDFLLDKSTLYSVHNVLKNDGLFVIVPEAKLTGQNPMTKAIEWLYILTGQRNVSIESAKNSQHLHKVRWHQIKSTFNEVGFDLKFKIIGLENSEVTLLIGRKLN